MCMRLGDALQFESCQVLGAGKCSLCLAAALQEETRAASEAHWSGTRNCGFSRMKAHTRSTWTSRQAVVLQGRGQALCTFLHPGTVADPSRSKVFAAAECSLWLAALLQEGMRAATGVHGHTRHTFADR